MLTIAEIERATPEMAQQMLVEVTSRLPLLIAKAQTPMVAPTPEPKAAKFDDTDEILTVPELAKRWKRTRGTTYRRLKGLTRVDGVLRDGQTRIVWPVLRQRMLDGKVVFRGEE